MNIWRAVRIIHPEWDEEKVSTEVRQIFAELAAEGTLDGNSEAG